MQEDQLPRPAMLELFHAPRQAPRQLQIRPHPAVTEHFRSTPHRVRNVFLSADGCLDLSDRFRSQPMTESVQLVERQLGWNPVPNLHGFGERALEARA